MILDRRRGGGISVVNMTYINFAFCIRLSFGDLPLRFFHSEKDDQSK